MLKLRTSVLLSKPCHSCGICAVEMSEPTIQSKKHGFIGRIRQKLSPNLAFQHLISLDKIRGKGCFFDAIFSEGKDVFL